MIKKVNQHKHKRVVVYLGEKDYTQLRIKLLLLGETVSSWFRKVVKDFLNGNGN